MEDDDSLNHQQSCPFCGTQDDCEHLALLVDRTYQTAEAGDLMDVSNSRWSDIVELAADELLRLVSLALHVRFLGLAPTT